MNHTMKLWERIIEHRLRGVNQTEYTKCNFSVTVQEEGMLLDDQLVPKKDTFHYLGFILHGNSDEDVSHRIKAG
jgi:hypothetical protein